MAMAIVEKTNEHTHEMKHGSKIQEHPGRKDTGVKNGIRESLHT